VRLFRPFRVPVGTRDWRFGSRDSTYPGINIPIWDCIFWLPVSVLKISLKHTCFCWSYNKTNVTSVRYWTMYVPKLEYKFINFAIMLMVSALGSRVGWTPARKEQTNERTSCWYFNFSTQRVHYHIHHWQQLYSKHVHHIDKCFGQHINHYLRSERTSYASETNLNTRSASCWFPGFLSGCHFRAILR